MTVTPAVSERFGVWFCQDSRRPNHTKPNGEDEKQPEAAQGSRKGRPRLRRLQPCQARRPCALSAVTDHSSSWKEGSKRLVAVSLKTGIKPAASRCCRGAGDSARFVPVAGLGEQGKDPALRPFRGGQQPCLRLRAGEERQGDTPRLAGEAPAAGPGAEDKDVTAARGAFPGSGARAWVGPAPPGRRATPLSPLAGGRAGKEEQTPVPGRGAGSAAAAAATSQPGPLLPLPLAVSPRLYGDRIRPLAPRCPLYGRPAPARPRVPAGGWLWSAGPAAAPKSKRAFHRC